MVNKIIQIISEVLETPINASTSQANNEKWDSLQHLNIIVALEEAFELSFEPEEIMEMTSIVAIERVVTQKK